MRLINLDTIKPIDFPSCEMDGLDVVRYLDALPTVDAVEVVHGEWVNIIHAVVDTTGYCTRCDKQAVWRTRNKPYAYCPNCGAKMRGSEE